MKIEADGHCILERGPEGGIEWVAAVAIGGDKVRCVQIAQQLVGAVNNCEAFHAALQRIGTALGLPAGTDLTTACVPAIQALRTGPTGPAAVRDAIGQLLTECMDRAVSNGANSRPMPDSYVLIAAWLQGVPS